MTQVLGHLQPHETQMELLAPAWPGPGHCHVLGRQQVWKISYSPSLTATLLFKQSVNKEKKKKLIKID